MKKHDAIIGKYLGLCELDDGYCYQVDPKSRREIEGYVIGNYIYDLNYRKRYYIIKRDEVSGLLENSQVNIIKTDVEYALEVKEKKFTKSNAKVKRITGPIKR